MYVREEWRAQHHAEAGHLQAHYPGFRLESVEGWGTKPESVPEGSSVLLWGILSQIIIMIPNLEARHSTRKV